MSRPEYVKCENCCYFSPTTDEVIGWCGRYPSIIETKVDAWCGEFRKEWPETVIIEVKQYACVVCRDYVFPGTPHQCRLMKQEVG